MSPRILIIEPLGVGSQVDLGNNILFSFLTSCIKKKATGNINMATRLNLEA